MFHSYSFPIVHFFLVLNLHRWLHLHFHFHLYLHNTLHILYLLKLSLHLVLLGSYFLSCLLLSLELLLQLPFRSNLNILYHSQLVSFFLAQSLIEPVYNVLQFSFHFRWQLLLYLLYLLLFLLRRLLLRHRHRL